MVVDTYADAEISADENHLMRPAPMLGEHTREVLREAGYQDAEIDRFAAEGVIENEPAVVKMEDICISLGTALATPLAWESPQISTGVDDEEICASRCFVRRFTSERYCICANPTANH
jgi:hypothetical protein